MSSPTYPACVKAVQSHIVNGTSRQRAIVCANSVLPEKKKNSFRKWMQNVYVKKKEPDFLTPKNGYCNNKIIIEMKLQVTTHKIELHCEALK